MRVLVAFECSGAVRDAFLARGHDAWSCDLKPSESNSERHIIGDALLAIVTSRWDLVIAHPPCTALALSGNRWYAGTGARESAVQFVANLARILDRDAGKWAIENPASVLSTKWRKPDQWIQPYQFGHGETKKTGLWLSNLPKLVPTDEVEGREGRVWRMGPSATRAADRARTYPGIAEAMADQWGGAVVH